MLGKPVCWPALKMKNLTRIQKAHPILELYIFDIFTGQRFKKLRISNYLVSLFIWDADGDRILEYLEQGMFDRCDGVIEVFDLSEKQTLHELESLHFQLKKRLKSKEIGMILAGNKVDVIPQTPQLKQSIKQCNYLADKFAKRQGILYLRTSAKQNSSVKDCFVELIKQVLIKRAANNGSGSGRGARVRMLDELRIDTQNGGQTERNGKRKSEEDQIQAKAQLESKSSNIGCNCCKAVRSCNFCSIF